MNVLRIDSWRGLTPWMALAATMGLYQVTAAQQQTPASQDGLEVLTRGPVHEAFAETISPSTAINLGVFARHLFLRPSYGLYYFGDYYGANYANAGYSPLVLIPIEPPRLRSDLRQRELAESARPWDRS